MQPLKAEDFFPELALRVKEQPEATPPEPAEDAAVPETRDAAGPVATEIIEYEIRVPAAEPADLDTADIVLEPAAAEDSPDDLCRERLALLEEVTEAVEAVVDRDSARPAIERLESVAARLQPVRERLRELPDPSEQARAELAERSAHILRRLNARAATIRSYPDLRKAIERTMRAD